MAFSLAYTSTIDTTTDVTRWNTTRDAIFYMTDTFLPARGWSVNNSEGTSGTVKRSVGWPMQDWRNSNTVEYYWSWFNVTSTEAPTISIYEDSRWTTTPGDNPNDSTNGVSWTVASSTNPVFFQDWKFWVSDEDNSLFLITQGSRLHWWGGDFGFGRWKPNSNYGPDDGSSDQHQTHYFPFYAESLRLANLPSYSGTNLAEIDLAIQIPSKYSDPIDAALVRNFTLSSTGETIGAINYNDIRLTIKASSSRNTSLTSVSSPGSDTFYKYLVNGTEWWLINGLITTKECMAFYMGTNEPDIS